MMMPVSLAIGGNVDQLRTLAVERKAARQTIGEALAIVEQPLKSHGLRQGSIVEKQRELLA